MNDITSATWGLSVPLRQAADGRRLSPRNRKMNRAPHVGSDRRRARAEDASAQPRRRSHFSVLATRHHRRIQTRLRRNPNELSRKPGWRRTAICAPDGTRPETRARFPRPRRHGGRRTISEVFIVDLPEDAPCRAPGPLQARPRGGRFHRKAPRQRRLTFTAGRKFPGVQGPRHCCAVRPTVPAPAFLMKDEGGLVQLWTVSPNAVRPPSSTHNPWSVASAFTWSPDGRHLAHAMDNACS